MKTEKKILKYCYTSKDNINNVAVDRVASWIEELGGDVFSINFFVGAIDIYFKIDEDSIFDFNTLNDRIKYVD